jgi:hypothetical protein
MSPTTRSRAPYLAILFAFLLWIPSLPAVAARPTQDTQRTASARDQMDAFCEEEKLHAEPWIRWAAANRAACRRQASDPAGESSCLSAVRQQLVDMEREHAAVYLGQMKALRPDHPVMQTILKRLRSNRDMAATAIDEDIEPMQLAALRKQLCISSFPR